MSYRIERGEAVQAAVRRIAREQIDKAIAELEDPVLYRHETVHQVRKRCKKLRGLLRLVRPALAGDTYARENACFRDAARTLSYVRDAQTLIGTFDALTGHFATELDPVVAEPTRQRLVKRRQQVAEDVVGLDERLERFLATMRAAYDRAGCWQLDADGYDPVAGGLEKTYARGRKAMTKAYHKPSPERFHEWRKRAKYHLYHLRLLQDVWRPVVKPLRGEAERLADLLGDDHDLAVLRQTVLKKPKRFGGEHQAQLLLGLIDRRRIELEAEARPLGERLFAEQPEALIGRLERYWAAWQREGEVHPALVKETRLVAV
jgi:CHAD domain-containing protein